MPRNDAHTTRRGRKGRENARAKGGNDVDLVVSIVRLGVGAWSLGTEELSRRLAATGQAAPARIAVRRTKSRRARPSRSAGFGWLVAGIAMESADVASRWLTTASAGGRRTRAAARAIRRAPGAGIAAGLLQAPMRRYRSSVAALQERGRVETREGRRMVSHLVRRTTQESVRDIAESAVREVAHSPEVAALVRTQSVGLATGTILQVRTTSEQADDRLEQRVRSWLHKPSPPTTDVGPSEPSPPGAPAA